MKIRAGFVSNSSSMSFVINKDSYQHVKDLARDMINYMYDLEQEEGFEEWYPESRRKELLKNLEEAPETNAIVFPSTNFDTFIYDDEYAFYVETCNNHSSWDFLDSLKDYRKFTIKTSFYDLRKKEFVDETIYDMGY